MFGKIKLLGILCFFLLSVSLAKAHSPNQITYAIDQDAEGGLLTIHLMPQGAIDLIIRLKPELANQAVIPLKMYYNEFTSYFNRTIDLKINGAAIKLVFMEGDLISHDAVLVYRLDGITELHGNFDISIHSFTEVYKRIRNHVIIRISKERKKCILDTNTRSCSFDLPQETSENQLIEKVTTNQEMSWDKKYLWIVGPLLILALTIIVVSFKNRNKEELDQMK
ncbi:MAG: hypothetical protein WBG90_21550 [Saonia sp.]